ncbi:MAG: hypothetical protein ACFCU4_06790 [Puniceicoccaceae bacterium]
MQPDLAEPIRTRLEAKRLIFTVATGRCGTAYLAHLFTFLPKVLSLHEPEPAYHHILRHALEKPSEFRRFLVEEKLPAIAAVDASIYVETSHLFCKGFIEPFVELGLKADLVIHRRDRRRVVSSLYRMGAIPGRTERGKQFYLDPEDPVRVPLPGWKELDDYQICLWYVLEIEARAEAYERLFREMGQQVVHSNLEEVRTLRGFRILYRSLNLKGPNPKKWLSYFRYGWERKNEIASAKKEKPLPENWEILEKQLLERVEKQ